MKYQEIYSQQENIDPLFLNRIVGENIKKIRHELKLSQEAFADVVGLHRTYIGQIERAEKNITIRNIFKICSALKIDPKELLNLDHVI